MGRLRVGSEDGRAQLAVLVVLALALAGAVAGYAWSAAGNHARGEAPAIAAEDRARRPASGLVPQVGHSRADVAVRAGARAHRRADRRGPPPARGRLERIASIGGAISPKSVVASQNGLVFAQNMMYRHSVTVYDRRHRLVKTIDDRVDLRRLGLRGPGGSVRGAPVEAAFSPDGRYAYVSNYELSGPGRARRGTDVCSPASAIDDSVVYRIDVRRLRIDRAVRVGAVPKFVAVSPDGQTLLVANWCSYDVSVIDTTTLRERARVPVGAYPRGIAVDPQSRIAYVALMGAGEIARVDLDTLRVRRWRDIGGGPRHLVLGRAGNLLYATLNADGVVAKIETRRGRVVGRVSTGRQPRSAALSADGRLLYVVNYESGTLVAVRTRDLKVVRQVGAGTRPVGVTVDHGTGEVWVADYAGALNVFSG